LYLLRCNARARPSPQEFRAPREFTAFCAGDDSEVVGM
jgi:hypothetical protein